MNPPTKNKPLNNTIIILIATTTTLLIFMAAPITAKAIKDNNKNMMKLKLQEQQASEDDDKNLITRILEEDNEILQDEEDEQGLNEMDKGKHYVKKIQLPVYLDTLFGDDKVELDGSSSEEEQGAYQHLPHLNYHKGPVARVWLPNEIIDVEMESGTSISSIVFQQTKRKESLEGFSKAEIILTMKSDAEFRDGSFIQLVIGEAGNQDEIKEKQRLSHNKRFYSFNITKHLERNLKSGLQHPNEIKVDFQILQDPSKTMEEEDRFHYIFDVQIQQPFVIFFYQDEQQLPIHSRGKRSVQEVDLIRSESESEDSLDLDCENCVKEFHTTTTEDNPTNDSSESTMEQSTTKLPISEPVELEKVSDDIDTLVDEGELPAVRPNHICQRVSWEVDTEDIDWFDAVMPRKIDLGYCAGGCPFPLQNDHFNFTLHSFFVDRFRLNKVFNVPKNFPKSCCVPISYKPIKVWIWEEDNSYVHKLVENVSVNQCGCR